VIDDFQQLGVFHLTPQSAARKIIFKPFLYSVLKCSPAASCRRMEPDQPGDVKLSKPLNRIFRVRGEAVKVKTPSQHPRVPRSLQWWGLSFLPVRW
jgi:hypothetical protein